MFDYSNASTIYLSQTTGNDRYSGYAPVADGYGDGPIKTLDRLHEMLWTLKASGNLQPLTVRLIGDYYMESPIKLGFPLASSHYASSHSMHNITFESYLPQQNGRARYHLDPGSIIAKPEESIFESLK